MQWLLKNITSPCHYQTCEYPGATGPAKTHRQPHGSLYMAKPGCGTQSPKWLSINLTYNSPHLNNEFRASQVELVVKEPACQCRGHKRCRFDPWVGKTPWRRAGQPTPVFLPGESHGQRSLAGYSPQGHKELDTTEMSQHSECGLTCDLLQPTECKES